MSPDGNIGKHAISQMRRCGRHPPSSTRRADPTTLTRKGHGSSFPASAAPQPQEASRKDRTVQKRAKFLLNKTRDVAVLLPAKRQERFQFACNDSVKQGLFGTPGLVAVRVCHEDDAKACRAPTRRTRVSTVCDGASRTNSGYSAISGRHCRQFTDLRLIRKTRYRMFEERRRSRRNSRI